VLHRLYDEEVLIISTYPLKLMNRHIFGQLNAKNASIRENVGKETNKQTHNQQTAVRRETPEMHTRNLLQILFLYCL
jgi:hypothetical protein